MEREKEFVAFRDLCQWAKSIGTPYEKEISFDPSPMG
jgi:hypothetical protein